MARACEFLDGIKNLGYRMAYEAGLSFNLDDIIVPPEKEGIVAKGQKEVDEIQANYDMGFITDNERYNQVINAWTHVNNELGDIKQVNFMTEECRRMKIDVLGPDVNESEYKFSVNDKGEIRYGMGGIKNVGEAAVSNIVEEREANGKFKDLTDFLMRTANKGLNRRAIESMGMAGCFDNFPGFHRAMLSYMPQNDMVPFVERALRMVASYNERKNSTQIDLFGFGSGEGEGETLNIPLPQCEPWSQMKQLEMEKEALGFYVSSHPMETYSIEIENFANINTEKLKLALENINNLGRNVRLAGQITKAEELPTKDGNSTYGKFVIEDQYGTYEFKLFKEKYMNMKHILVPGSFVLLIGSFMKSYRKNPEGKESIDVFFNNVYLLSSLLENTNKKVKIQLFIDIASDDDVLSLIKLFKDNPGKQSYSVNIYDRNANMSCNMTPVSGNINAAVILPLFKKQPYSDFVKFELK